VSGIDHHVVLVSPVHVVTLVPGSSERPITTRPFASISRRGIAADADEQYRQCAQDLSTVIRVTISTVYLFGDHTKPVVDERSHHQQIGECPATIVLRHELGWLQG
jgi:hypothetical protein